MYLLVDLYFMLQMDLLQIVPGVGKEGTSKFWWKPSAYSSRRDSGRGCLTCEEETPSRGPNEQGASRPFTNGGGSLHFNIYRRLYI